MEYHQQKQQFVQFVGGFAKATTKQHILALSIAHRIGLLFLKAYTFFQDYIQRCKAFIRMLQFIGFTQVTNNKQQITALSQNQKYIYSQMDQSKLRKQKPAQKTHIKLPYLQRVDKPKPKSSTRDLLLPQQKQFDLFTSNSRLPAYNPQQDMNLKMFFEKPMNKKILQKLKEHSRKSHYSRRDSHQTKPQQVSASQVNQLNKSKPLRIDTQNEKKSIEVMSKKPSSVTSHEFLSYLENVRKRILSTGVIAQLQKSTNTAI